jgi:hypothetical protein
VASIAKSSPEMLTIRLAVMRLAIPNPCGMISAHRWKADVCSFQDVIKTLARTAQSDDAKVSV